VQHFEPVELFASSHFKACQNFELRSSIVTPVQKWFCEKIQSIR
jgi:hypothetical protein